MAHSGGKKSNDASVTKATRLARIKHTAMKLLREEKALKEAARESEEAKKVFQGCGKCRGEGEESEFAHMDDLCPAERQRLSELIKSLVECTREKNKAEEELETLRAEKGAMESRYELLHDKSEDEKSQLKSQLADAVAEVNKLKLQTSQSFNLLTQQMKAREREFSHLTITRESLLREKSQLEKSLDEKEAKLRDAEAKIERDREKAEMDKLLMLRDRVQKFTVELKDRSTQTNSLENTSFSASPMDSRSDTASWTKFLMQKLPSTRWTKNKDDLEHCSAEDKVVEDVFFSRKNFNPGEYESVASLLPRP